jgi:HSP20 family protein
MLLTSFDPFTRDFDRIVERAFGPRYAFRPGTAAGMPMDAVRTENGLTLRFDLPGIDPASIEAGHSRGVLAVQVPLAEAAKPRKVEIQAEAPKGITA